MGNKWPPARMNYNVPKITYKEAMALSINNQPLATCSEYVFAEAIERLVMASAHPAIIRVELLGHEYGYATDKWSALEILARHRVKFDHVFKPLEKQPQEV